MTSPQFISWLDDKMQVYDKGKVIPPVDVLAESLEKATEQKVRQREIDRILREAGIDDIVANRMYRLTGQLQNIDARHEVTEALENNPSDQ